MNPEFPPEFFHSECPIPLELLQDSHDLAMALLPGLSQGINLTPALPELQVSPRDNNPLYGINVSPVRGDVERGSPGIVRFIDLDPGIHQHPPHNGRISRVAGRHEGSGSCPVPLSDIDVRVCQQQHQQVMAGKLASRVKRCPAQTVIVKRVFPVNIQLRGLPQNLFGPRHVVLSNRVMEFLLN